MSAIARRAFDRERRIVTSANAVRTRRGPLTELAASRECQWRPSVAELRHRDIDERFRARFGEVDTVAAAPASGGPCNDAHGPCRTLCLVERRLGYDYRTHAGILRQYARFADDRGDRVVRTATVTEWASAAVSRHQAAPEGCTSCTPSRLWMHAEDAPPRAPAKGLLRPSFQSAPRRRT